MRANSIDTEFSCADTCGRTPAGFPEWTPDPGNGSRSLRQYWQRRRSHVPVTFATAMRQDAFSARHGEVPPGRGRPGYPGQPNSPPRQAAVTGLPPRLASLPGKPGPDRAAVLLDTPGRSVAGVAILAGAPIRNARMPSVCPARAAPGSIAAGTMDFQRAGHVGSIVQCAARHLPWRKIVCPDGSGRRNDGNADCTLKSERPVNHSASTDCVVPRRHTGCGAAQARWTNASRDDGGGKIAGLFSNRLMLKNAGTTSPRGGASFRALRIAITFPISDKCPSNKCATLSKADSGLPRSGRTLAASVFGTYSANGVTVADRICAVEQEFELSAQPIVVTQTGYTGYMTPKPSTAQAPTAVISTPAATSLSTSAWKMRSAVPAPFRQPMRTWESRQGGASVMMRAKARC